MKAIVQLKYGAPSDVLHYQDITQPLPGENEVLVRVRAASMHPDVWHVVTGRPHVLRLMGSGLLKPKNPIPGTDMAGIVEAVGNGVTQFKPGDAVFGECAKGFQWANGGAFAQFVCVSPDALALKPASLSFEQTATVPTAGLIALHNLRSYGSVQPGQRVLVNGAGGGVGSIALQLAKAYGAQVTAVDGPTKLAMLRALGADHVIDYTQADFTRSGKRYDLIFDVASNLSLSDCKRALTPTGIYVLIGHDHYGKSGKAIFGSLPRFIRLLARTPFEPHLPKMNFSAPNKKEVMAVLKGFLESGQLTPVIDKTFPLHEAAEAMRYLESGQACGRIVLTA